MYSVSCIAAAKVAVGLKSARQAHYAKFASAFIEVILDVALGRLQTDHVKCAIVQFVRGDTAAVQLAAGQGL